MVAMLNEGNDDDDAEDDAAAADDDDDDDDNDNNEADQVVLELLVALVKEELATMDDNNSNTYSNIIVVESAREFVVALGADIHDMLTNPGITAEGYAGLDLTRDTEDEVETALRIYPEVLAQRSIRFGICGRFLLPIQCIMFNFQHRKMKCNRLAIEFVPLFAALAIEYQLFNEEERGGLLIDINAEGNTPYIVTVLNFLQYNHATMKKIKNLSIQHV